MEETEYSRLSPDELRMMADSSGDPIIARSLCTLAEEYEEDLVGNNDPDEVK